MSRPTLKPLDPLNVQTTVTRLFAVIDDMVLVTHGWRASERTALMEAIVRMSLICRNHPENRGELDRLLDKYEQEYGWLWEM